MLQYFLSFVSIYSFSYIYGCAAAGGGGKHDDAEADDDDESTFTNVSPTLRRDIMKYIINRTAEKKITPDLHQHPTVILCPPIQHL